MTRAKMSTVMNEGFYICCKEVTSQVFTVVFLLVELSMDIVKPKGSIDASTYIKKPSVIVTSNCKSCYIFLPL